MQSVIYATIFGTFLAAAPAFAAEDHCAGTDLGATIPAAEHARMAEEEALTPHAKGLVWEARRGQAHMTIAGTYHLDDPRLEGLAERLHPALDAADALLVEATLDDMTRLQQEIADDPALLLIGQGEQSLIQRLGPDLWDQLSTNLAERGIPPMAAAQMRPWYASMMLGFSPCMMRNMAENGMAGLDARLMDHAEAIDLPITALEPWNTIFDLFDDLSPDDEIEMIKASLPLAGMMDDMTTTVANAYFDGRGWLIWGISAYLTRQHSNLSPETITEQLELTQEVLVNTRNHAWIAPMEAAAEAAATRDKGIAVAVGLLHLPGEEGVLSLLESRGWDISPVE